MELKWPEAECAIIRRFFCQANVISTGLQWFSNCTITVARKIIIVQMNTFRILDLCSQLILICVYKINLCCESSHLVGFGVWGNYFNEDLSKCKAE